MNGIFNNPDFYPTPAAVINQMLSHINPQGATILEPSAGKGDIIDALKLEGADVLFCETSQTLQKILQDKGRFLKADFLDVQSHEVSHINAIVMNPPFSNGTKHILHAYDIAPEGCKIVALCNYSNYERQYTEERKKLGQIIDSFGTIEKLGNCFSNAERSTDVEVGLIVIQKAGENVNEFEGFFMDDEPEEDGEAPGIMKYNAIRDIVNRYVKACKIYDEQLETAVRMNQTIGSFFSEKMGFQVTAGKVQVSKNEFKKELQRQGWQYIFSALKLQQDMTRGVRETINKFIEQQKAVPFTMRNIYKMLEIVIGTREQTMDKAILEAFDRITEHHHENRHNIKGWKTNLHYLVGKKFILPYQINPAKEYGYTSEYYNSLKNSYDGTVPDLEKALCFIAGKSYNDTKTVNQCINRNIYGEWYESDFFKYKGYKNGNMHFEFKDQDIWEKFNQKVAKLKGYPLYEPKKQTAYQNRNAGRKTEPKQKAEPKQMETLFEI